MEDIAISPKPAWRGRLHQVAFLVSVPAGVSLVMTAGTAMARIGALVYAVSLSGMYAASAAFHRIDWRPRTWRWMRRLDHSMIYVLIAGTYTPFSLLVLEGAWTIVVLSVVWTGALFGVVWKLSTSRLPALGAALYLVLGWVAVVAIPAIVGRLSIVEIVLLGAGGVLYTAGSVILLRRRPDPNPSVFGYHEVWHSMVIAASACHYALILMIVL
jgi:hemolysin III